MVEQATVDANGESEEVTGWFTMIEEHLSLPFETKILGIPAVVMRVDADSGDADRPFRPKPITRTGKAITRGVTSLGRSISPALGSRSSRPSPS